MTDLSNEDLPTNLNMETGKIEWEDLQRFYAQGVVLVVDSALDLVETANFLTDNQTEEIEKLINENKISKANDDQAKQWISENTVFWAIVVAPWVVIQSIKQ